ncbi:MAG: hypothetical protein LC685_01665, partial [Actinobacteria bacterium]|nr:hypothetical protein [Actinomycetota bacterium]
HSSARDLVTLADKLLENPLFAKAADSSTATLNTGDHPRQIDTRNLLLDSYPFVTGIKTGHTIDAGYVLVGSGEKNGTTLISAVLGTPSEGARDADTIKLLRYGFSLYKSSTPVRAGSTLSGPELDYDRGKLDLEATRSVQVSTRENQRVDTEVDIPGQLQGAVEKGRPIGEVRVTVDGRVAGSSPLVAAEGVGAAGIFRKALSALSGPLILLPLGLIVIIAGLMLASGRRLRLPRVGRGSRGDGAPDSSRPLGAGGRGPDGNGSRSERGREKSQRTAEDRERMRKERMDRRGKQRTPGEGQ